MKQIEIDEQNTFIFDKITKSLKIDIFTYLALKKNISINLTINLRNGILDSKINIIINKREEI